jgi:hypothetical protein
VFLGYISGLFADYHNGAIEDYGDKGAIEHLSAAPVSPAARAKAPFRQANYATTYGITLALRPERCCTARGGTPKAPYTVAWTCSENFRVKKQKAKNENQEWASVSAPAEPGRVQAGLNGRRERGEFMPGLNGRRSRSKIARARVEMRGICKILFK